MAKHAKPYVEGSEERDYVIHVEETFYGTFTINGTSLEEVLSLASEVEPISNLVKWEKSQVRFLPAPAIENHFQ